MTRRISIHTVPPTHNANRHPMKTLRGISGFSFLLMLLFTAGCAPSDPAGDVQLAPAPAGTREFFQPGIEAGVLYAYVTAEGDIFVYRRDLDVYGWVTLPQFRRFVSHAKSRGGCLVYSLEDGDLKQPACRDAFMCILNAKMNTQDPVELLPLLKQELLERKHQ